MANRPTAELGRARVLLTNDDGIFAEGMELLAHLLEETVELVVVAPDRERSGSSHSITLHHPLRAREIRPSWFAVDGTPTDCVNLAIHHLLRDRPPTLVVSGVNLGLNIGDDVTYSGTVGAALEGSLLGFPALALSQDTSGPYDLARTAQLSADFVAALLEDASLGETLLNVNFPSEEPRGWTYTRLGRRFYREVVVEKTDPRGRQYFWIGGTPDWQRGEGTDCDAVAGGLVSITPLQLDLTDFEALERKTPWQSRLSHVLPVGEVER